MEAKNIKVAGFGGQGVMMFGQILAYSATKDEINGLWFPSYGPETRGVQPIVQLSFLINKLTRLCLKTLII